MEQKLNVPKKKEQSHYSAAARDSIKGSMKGKELYKAFYGRDGTDSEVQTLINRLNAKRSNPGADIIGDFVERLPHLKDMTLGEFFKIKS
jgi:hypothetical protein